MLSQAAALGFVASALGMWPSASAAIRLARAINDAEGAAQRGYAVTGRDVPSWVRSGWLRVLLVGALAVGLAQLWSWPVAVAIVAVTGTACRALFRGHRARAAVREEQAAVEGLGVLVAELRAGRPADVALTTAGRHCGDPVVEAVLTRLGRSLRLGARLQDWSIGESEATLARGRRLRGQAGGPDWQERLIEGVRLSQRTGCALADVVGAVESDLARRGRRRADLRAAAAGHRATVALLAGLPILGLAMGSGIGAEPVAVLTTTAIGHFLLLTGVGLELLGLAWSRILTGRALREG